MSPNYKIAAKLTHIVSGLCSSGGSSSNSGGGSSGGNGSSGGSGSGSGSGSSSGSGSRRPHPRPKAVCYWS